jgi:hypothetical protein
MMTSVSEHRNSNRKGKITANHVDRQGKPELTAPNSRKARARREPYVELLLKIVTSPIILAPSSQSLFSPYLSTKASSRVLRTS